MPHAFPFRRSPPSGLTSRSHSTEQPVTKAQACRRERFLQEKYVNNGHVQHERQPDACAQSHRFANRPAEALRSAERALKTLYS
jgi:hypothetical protein